MSLTPLTFALRSRGTALTTYAKVNRRLRFTLDFGRRIARIYHIHSAEKEPSKLLGGVD